MKKQYLFLVVIIFLIPLVAKAKINKYVNVGMTFSTLRTQGGKSEWGKFLGFGIEYYKPSSLLFALDAAYATKKVTLENKSWPSGFDLLDSDALIGNVDIHGSFLEFSAKIGYNFSIVGNQVSLTLFTGPAFSTQLKYIGDLRADRTIFLDPDERGKYKFDYLRDESEKLPESSMDYIIGTTASYKKLGVEIRFARALTRRKGLWALSINDKIDCFYILLRYAF
jgi:hypothetical protein